MTNKELIEKLLIKNTQYIKGNFELVQKYLGGKKVLVKNKYGICKMNIGDIVRSAAPSIKSAVDKNKYCVNQITENTNFNYSYSKVIYINQKTKVEIICPIHGSFWQLPYSHKKGHGCNKCNKEAFYKVGITKNLKNRIRDIEGKSNYKVEVMHYRYKSIKEAYELEQCYIKTFKDYKKSAKQEFGGHTECFTENPINMENCLYEEYEDRRKNNNYEIQ